MLPWDGVRRPREEWNRDQDLRSAMKHSVVWYYQELARRVGPDRQDPGAPQPHGWWVGSVEKEGSLFLYAARIEGPGASGTVCRPMAEKALAALGVLPAR